VETAIPNFVIHETIAASQALENVAMCTPEIRVNNGFINAPEGPGLGVDLVEKAFAGYDKIKVG